MCEVCICAYDHITDYDDHNLGNIMHFYVWKECSSIFFLLLTCHLMFLDLEKAYDKMIRHELWTVLHKHRVDVWLLNAAGVIDGGIKANVIINDMLNQWFKKNRK